MAAWPLHLDVAHVMNRPHAARGLESAVEDRKMRILDRRRTLDGLVLVDVLDHLFELLRVVAKLVQRHRHGLVHDLDDSAVGAAILLVECSRASGHC
jgi:hypothetical protein